MNGIRTSRQSTLSAFTGLILLALAWFYLAPVQLGGRAVYLIIDGISMQPTFYTGDLVILHQTDRYEIGDAAAYQLPNGGIVIHRIIGQEGDRFIFLGDNKPAPDMYRPLLSEMVGKYQFHIPGLGKLVSQHGQEDQLLSTPQLLLTGLGFLTLIPGAKKPSKRQRLKKRKEQPGSMNQFNQNKINKSDLLLFLIVLAVISAALVYLGFSQPLTRPQEKNITYTQKGTFSYSAPAPPGIYSSDQVQTGEPIFRALINQVTVSFDYEFDSEETPDALTGSYTIIAEVEHSNGWKSSLELVPETSFSGQNFNMSTAVDLSEIQGILDNLQQQTGLSSSEYTLVIIPKVRVAGLLHQQPVEDEFAPRLTFDFSPVQISLTKSKTDRSGDSAEKQLEPSQSGSVKTEQEAPNSFSVYRFQVFISLVRYIGLSGLMISLSGLIILGVTMVRAQQAGEAARIQFKYGGRLTPIRETHLTNEEDVVEMASIDDLIRLGERQGCPILYFVRGSTHHYLVKDAFTTYRYQVSENWGEHDPRDIDQVLTEST